MLFWGRRRQPYRAPPLKPSHAIIYSPVEKATPECSDETDLEQPSSSTYPLPVGDVTCLCHPSFRTAPHSLLWGWLVTNKTQCLSGITVALAQIPEAVSFSFVAGVDPIVGLQSAWIMGICTSLVGCRPGMVAGATCAVVVVLPGLIKEFGIGHMFYAIMLVGILQMLFGLLTSFDVLAEQRLENIRRAAEQRAQGGSLDPGIQIGGGGAATPAPQAAGVAAEEALPPLLLRRYELRILPRRRSFSGESVEERGGDGLALRQVRSRSVGHLVSLTGMIVRCTDVKPHCVVATYTCDACGAEIYQDIASQREFLPHRKCPAPNCPAKSSSESLLLQTRGSKFVKFQEWKMQELPNQVPMGHVPRSLSIHVRGELTRNAVPGDVVTVDGVFLPLREEGYKLMTSGLIVATYLEAMNVIVHKKSFEDTNEDQTLLAEVKAIAEGVDPVGKLSQSLAPEIYGHDDIKKALLLQLVGGCERKLPDGMRIRGDINICLMGDPGVAKSQLLKFVSGVAPRGVYTTGRGSSGVGLTAAVTKDGITGELALEGGALVLADRGICCIDEFDKMDDADRTAIHEVMEQQTVSIAKAGIVATLNARAAVLAAANPLYGRYHRKKSLSENINLPNSLLSRFDLLFLVLDKADLDRDMALARHVTLVHQTEGSQEDTTHQNDTTTDTLHPSNPNTDNDTPEKPISSDVLREYISQARQLQPMIPPDVAPYIIEAYISLRMDANNATAAAGGDQTVMTPRQLLSILRLSQALARLRFSDSVARDDVDEAIRLTHMSKASLMDEDGGGMGGGNHRQHQDVLSRIFDIVRDYATMTNQSTVEIGVCEAMILRKGFTREQFQECINEYVSLDVFFVNTARTHLSITNSSYQAHQ